MAVTNATTIRQAVRAVPHHRIAASLGTTRSRVGRALRGVDDLSALLAVLGLEVVRRA